MSALDHLLKLADRYINATEVAAVTLSWRVFGDSKKLDAIRAGSDIQVRRYEKALRWFADNWPLDAQWPEGVPYPAPEPAAETAAASGAAA